jgi:hypothetical protein
MQTSISKLGCFLLLALSTLGASAAINLSGAVQSPRVSFAAGDLKQACAEVQPAVANLSVNFVEDKSLGAQAYHIAVNAPGQFTVSGGDSIGLMYGGLQLAERIRIDHGIERIRAESGSPYLPYRALKMNIPLDARTPSYDDSGDSALWNIATIWDFSFWQGSIKDLENELATVRAAVARGASDKLSPNPSRKQRAAQPAPDSEEESQ